MFKINQVWEWFLTLESMQLVLFWVFAWIPACAILGIPLFTSTDLFTTDHTYLGGVRIMLLSLMGLYLLYVPIIADSVRKFVLKRRKL